jgi:hypothetical protein
MWSSAGRAASNSAPDPSNQTAAGRGEGNHRCRSSSESGLSLPRPSLSGCAPCSVKQSVLVCVVLDRGYLSTYSHLRMHIKQSNRYIQREPRSRHATAWSRNRTTRRHCQDQPCISTSVPPRTARSGRIRHHKPSNKTCAVRGSHR